MCRTEDGLEMQMGVNHMGHFLLTNLLVAMLKVGEIKNNFFFGAELTKNSIKDFKIEQKFPFTSLFPIRHPNRVVLLTCQAWHIVGVK